MLLLLTQASQKDKDKLLSEFKRGTQYIADLSSELKNKAGRVSAEEDEEISYQLEVVFYLDKAFQKNEQRPAPHNVLQAYGQFLNHLAAFLRNKPIFYIHKDATKHHSAIARSFFLGLPHDMEQTAAEDWLEMVLSRQDKQGEEQFSFQIRLTPKERYDLYSCIKRHQKVFASSVGAGAELIERPDGRVCSRIWQGHCMISCLLKGKTNGPSEKKLSVNSSFTPETRYYPELVLLEAAPPMQEENLACTTGDGVASPRPQSEEESNNETQPQEALAERVLPPSAPSELWRILAPKAQAQGDGHSLQAAIAMAASLLFIVALAITSL